jgi:hypothetical protein
VFSATDPASWTTAAGPSFLNGTALKLSASSRSRISSVMDGPASLQFSAKGGFRYGFTDLKTNSTTTFSTPVSTVLPELWQDFRFHIPAGRHRVYWEGFGWHTEGYLDAVKVNSPVDYPAISEALNFPGAVSFPTAGEWSVDSGVSLLGGTSLRQPAYTSAGAMDLTVTGPGVFRFALRRGGDGSSSGINIQNGKQQVYGGYGMDWVHWWFPMACYLPAGTHQLRFTNPSLNGLVWLDSMAVDPPGQGLAEALGYPGPWTISGAVPWHAQGALSHQGGAAAAVTMPAANPSDNAVLETVVEGPSILGFFTHFPTDGKPLCLIDTATVVDLTPSPLNNTIPVWQENQVLLPAGSHRVRWLSAKSNPASAAHFALDTVSVESPAEIMKALDTALPWSLAGLRPPRVLASSQAIGGTWLSNPYNPTGTCSVSFPLPGACRVRFRSNSRSAFYTIWKNNSPRSPNSIIETVMGSSLFIIQLVVPAADRLDFDLQKPGPGQPPEPLVLDALSILPLEGTTWIEWARLQPGFSSFDPDIRSRDPDGDQRSNFFEYAMDTNPSAKDTQNDILRIVPAHGGDPAQLVLKWNPQQIDAAWAIQESADLKNWSDRWIPDPATALPGADGFLSWSQPISGESKKGWFRAIVRPVVF